MKPNTNVDHYQKKDHIKSITTRMKKVCLSKSTSSSTSAKLNFAIQKHKKNGNSSSIFNRSTPISFSNTDYIQQLYRQYGTTRISLKEFEKLLVANRGEIATRILRSAHEIGCRTVSIYAKQDASSVHRYKADGKLFYLNILL